MSILAWQKKYVVNVPESEDHAKSRKIDARTIDEAIRIMEVESTKPPCHSAEVYDREGAMLMQYRMGTRER